MEPATPHPQTTRRFALQAPADRRPVLIADDDPVSRTLLARLLEPRGFTVVESASGLAAYALTQQTAFALIVLDIAMPGVSGNVLCQMIRDTPQGADLPIIAYTLHNTLEDIAHMRLAGFNDILFKPAHRRNLEEVLERTLAPA